MEKKLFNWYEDLKKKNNKIITKMIKKKTIKITKIKEKIKKKK